jgi:hypothetical protein
VVRDGAALLAGLVVCGRCGAKMTVRYYDPLLVQIGQEPLERSRLVTAAALQATAVPLRPVPVVTRRLDPSLPVLPGC